jgi:hypothetical protein
MRRLLMIAAAFSLVCAGVSTASAQTIDAKGKCHAANGKFAKAEVCAKAAKPAPTHCRNDKGKFAKCGSPGAHPA